MVQCRPLFVPKLQPALLCSDTVCLLGNTVQFKSWNLASGVNVVHVMQEELKKADAKNRSLEATVECLHGKVQIGLDKEWLLAHKTKDLDGRMTGVEATVSWFSWWTSYASQFIHWHTPQAGPSTPR